MAVLLYFLMSLMIVVAGFILIGVTFYQWRQQAKNKTNPLEQVSPPNLQILQEDSLAVSRRE